MRADVGFRSTLRFIPPLVSRGFFLTAVIAGSGSAVSCRSDGDRESKAVGSPAHSHLDRLAATYPELRAGRYAVIADFEDPNHAELFHAVGSADGRRDAVSPVRLIAEPRGGRAETGSGCLRATLSTPDDAILIDNDHATHWALKRDWHEYDLLLLAVHSPSAAEVLLTVRSGLATGQRRTTEEPSPRPSPLKGEGEDGTKAGGADASGPRTATTRQRLTRGWDLLRFDLADLGEHVALDDVREIRISAGTTKWPIELRLDDIILTASRTIAFGDPDARDGAMFTYQKGRRYHIGAGGKFELVFGNGEIVGWYDLARDPRRVRNLWDGVSFGFARKGGAKSPGAEPGAGIVVSSRLQEANAVRSVMVVEVHTNAEAPSDAAGLVYRWTFSIYPTGKTYTLVEFGSRFVAAFIDPPLLRFSRQHSDIGELGSNWFSGWPPLGVDRQNGVYTPNGLVSMVLVAAIPMDESKSFDRRSPLGGDGISFGTANAEQFDRTKPWFVSLAHSDQSLGRLHPALVDVDAGAFPGFFDGPKTIALVARSGKIVSESASFDAGSGTYRVNAKGGSVRLELGTGQGWFPSPAFVIAETPKADAWVYADGKLVTTTARDADGNLIFQLPGVIREKTIVEVLFDKQGATAPK